MNDTAPHIVDLRTSGSIPVLRNGGT